MQPLPDRDVVLSAAPPFLPGALPKIPCQQVRARAHRHHWKCASRAMPPRSPRRRKVRYRVSMTSSARRRPAKMSPQGAIFATGFDEVRDHLLVFDTSPARPRPPAIVGTYGCCGRRSLPRPAASIPRASSS